MKTPLSLLLLLSTFSFAHAARTQGQIHSIIYSDDPAQPHILRLTNGRAVLIENDKLDELTHERNSTDEIQFELNVDNIATAVVKTSATVAPVEENAPSLLQSAEPTLIPSLDEATKIFNRLNYNYQRKSECSNRAHVWAYEEATKNNIVTTKTFIFFTANYIRDHKFIWWFHVAPTLTVNNNGTIEKRVLDYRYMDRPATVEEWKNLLVYSKRPCVETTKFSEYDFNPHIDHCYLMYSNMYYWMPQDFKNEEATGKIKSTWNMGEVRAAYSEAF